MRMAFIWEDLVRRAMFVLDAEQAHELGLQALRLGLGAILNKPPDVPASIGPVERFGLRFANPLGMAAGFDKNGVVFNQLAQLGFGFVEVGTVTYRPQPGNPKPRLFRLPQDKALLNRLGFNNEGAAAVAERLSKVERHCIVGVNIGRNKDVDNDEAIENYLACLDIVHPVADYIAINVSSPNTPGLRDLQRADSLDDLLAAVRERNDVLNSGLEPIHGEIRERPRPLLVKISPDLDVPEIRAIAEIAMSNSIDGIIATNTTVSREGLTTLNVSSLGDGGISGRPLTTRANVVVAELYKATAGKLPIIGVGGIFTSQDAFDRIAAGASLLQAYTGFVYAGPGFPARIIKALAEILQEKGYKTLDEAVGSATRQ